MSEQRPIDRPVSELHPNERLKAESRLLRGTIEEGLADPITGALREADTQLTKFHGFYQQDDRDLRDERRRQKLEPAYQMMLRLRLPGGTCTPKQWLQLDDIAGRYADGSLRLTTRQTFQFHGVLKRNIKTTIQAVDAALLDSIAACGDVNRTVMAAVNPHESRLHAEVQRHAQAVSDHLLPRTGAYREIWLDGERVDPDAEAEPIYGPTYLPRKFKIGYAVPPVNDVDVYSQDLGFIAIRDEDGGLAGFNVLIGGGMGRTENETSTFPRLSDVIGFCAREQMVAVAEAVVTTQRDYGNREDRKRARLKYTLEDYGTEWFRGAMERRMGFALGEPRPYHFEHNGDRYGWTRGEDGRWHYTLFIENGRIRDREDGLHLRSALREIARVHKGEFQLTPNQNLTIVGVPARSRKRIERLLEAHGVLAPEHRSALRLNSMACVAFPTCGLAMAESERYLPDLVTKIEGLAETAGIAEQPIVIRMTGCPNGCARPYLAEIGFTGRAPGKYNMYLGGGFHGQRLNKPYLENIDEARILSELEGMFRRYAAERDAGEPFGDFVIRAGYVPEVTAGRHFHD
ncbi:NADPH-dependent assimilatory sulfite reductase hemoprotein subunit [Sediminicurvatus halobius]|uniref:Sulfite reductase [NADPH] hemoprotein beta-component n=1 Tax=Sediminicurvatus halobius TaxID=2182432 RepID=A0A2U2MW20_9GAMM|nr:NADPH-dependent assimilatory sulfite reductase hemoprotein subunit [Spiribacter halobius]PWG61061.1 sulfite reductase [Spiribacter halobius]UEX76766.1 NADPH-dependent assimilatory sulfite reductase hemoprotein subunit [Spiribacter halobius]